MTRRAVGFSILPVGHAASLHICAVTADCERLELQYAETPFFDELVKHALPRAVEGECHVTRVPGMGVALDATLAQELGRGSDSEVGRP